MRLRPGLTGENRPHHIQCAFAGARMTGQCDGRLSRGIVGLIRATTTGQTVAYELDTNTVAQGIVALLAPPGMAPERLLAIHKFSQIGAIAKALGRYVPGPLRRPRVERRSIRCGNAHSGHYQLGPRLLCIGALQWFLRPVALRNHNIRCNSVNPALHKSVAKPPY